MKRSLPWLLVLLVPVAAALSFRALWAFVWGYYRSQEWWDASVFVWYLMTGLALAAVAVVASEAARRQGAGHVGASISAILLSKARLDLSEEIRGAASAAVYVARVLLLVQLIAFLLCNAGPARTVVITVSRVMTTWGMARDLPIPSQPQ